MRTLIAVSCAFFFLASTLGPNQNLEQQVEPGQVQTITVPLRAGDYVRLAVAEKSEGINISLVDPEGQLISGPVNPVSAETTVRVSAIADRDGLYRLEVRPMKSSKSAIGYVASIEELRAAVESDKPRVAGERLVTEAEKLRAEGSAANLRAAQARYDEAIRLFQTAGDRKMLAITYHLCGLVHDYLNEFKASAECYERGIAVRKEDGDARAEGETHANVAPVYRQTGDLAKAKASLERAIMLLRGSGD